MNPGHEFYFINSNYRNPAFNKSEGGSGGSEHQYGEKLDFQVRFRGADDPIHPYDDLVPRISDPSEALWRLMNTKGFAVDHTREYDGRVQDIEW